MYVPLNRYHPLPTLVTDEDVIEPPVPIIVPLVASKFSVAVDGFETTPKKMFEAELMFLMYRLQEYSTPFDTLPKDWYTPLKEAVAAIVSAVVVPSGATVVFAVIVGDAFVGQLAVVLNAWLCNTKLVRTFSISPSGPTRVAVSFDRLKVRSPVPSVGLTL